MRNVRELPLPLIRRGTTTYLLMGIIQNRLVRSWRQNDGLVQEDYVNRNTKFSDNLRFRGKGKSSQLPRPEGRSL